MTTLQNEKDTINITFNDIIEKQDIITKQHVYNIKMPTITCNNEKTARYIQKEINKFTNKFIQNFINN